MGEGIPLPDWASYLTSVGQRLAELPTCEFGEPSARVVLSVPTGRFTYWMMVAGALSVTPQLDDNFQDGEVVTTWLTTPFVISDVELRSVGDAWQLPPPEKRLKSSLKAVRTPPDAPESRRSSRLPQELRDSFRIMQSEGQKKRNLPWYVDYTMQCLRPIVIIGRGREYIQEQRRILVDTTPNWFDDDALSFLKRDALGVFEGDQMLFHPYMILDESVGKTRPWIRPMTPRLTVVTSWNSHAAMSASLFSRRPRVIVANRRVKGSAGVLSSLRDLRLDADLQRLIDLDRPPGIEAFVFTEPAQGPTSSENGVADEYEDGI